MKKLILALTMLMVILSPISLEPARYDCYVPDYPCKIMVAGSFEYWLVEPGGEIVKHEKS